LKKEKDEEFKKKKDDVIRKLSLKEEKENGIEVS
jgi:hypothetical protein